MLDILPEVLREPTVLAIPFFVVMLTLEGFAAWRLEREDDVGQLTETFEMTAW